MGSAERKRHCGADQKAGEKKERKENPRSEKIRE